MNTVLAQELLRFNRLTETMKRSLFEIQRALTGLVVMSGELEAMGNSMLIGKGARDVDGQSRTRASSRCGPWVADLLQRLEFLNSWSEAGTAPNVFWISGFFFPQAFITGTLQNYARKYQLPIDTVSFSYLMMSELAEELVAKPEDGCYVDGLFIEGARWDPRTAQSLQRPAAQAALLRPCPSSTSMPEQGPRRRRRGGVYRCPVYKVL